ncbi:MAG: hypothetical protein RRC34_09680 [Lentisphaeria bacterium]|nr:hypothetical protein [Lentisphaeria bacterium]
MKKIFTTALLIIAGAGIALFVWKRFFTSEEAVIAKRCRALGEAASFSGDDGLAAIAIRGERLKSLLADTCRVRLRTYEMNETFSRDEIVSRHVALRQYWSSLSIHVYDSVVLEVGKAEAAVHFTARATAVEKSGRRNIQTVPVWASLKKVDGTWRFEEFREENVFEK